MGNETNEQPIKPEAKDESPEQASVDEVIEALDALEEKEQPAKSAEIPAAPETVPTAPTREEVVRRKLAANKEQLQKYESGQIPVSKEMIEGLKERIASQEAELSGLGKSKPAEEIQQEKEPEKEKEAPKPAPAIPNGIEAKANERIKLFDAQIGHLGVLKGSAKKAGNEAAVQSIEAQIEKLRASRDAELRAQKERREAREKKQASAPAAPEVTEPAKAEDGVDKEILEREAQAEISKLSPEEQEKVSLGLRNIGYKIEEAKDSVYAGAYRKAATKLGPESSAGRFFASLAEQFERKREHVKESQRKIEEGKKEGSNTSLYTKAGNIAYAAGNIVKYGRIGADLVGWSAMAPLRGAMLGVAVAASSAEALKDSRLKNAAVVEKTRIQDVNAAAQEAWSVYALARKSAKEGKPLSKKEIEQAYSERIPKDLLERLAGTEGASTGVMQRLMRKHIQLAARRMDKKIAAIEASAASPLEKNRKKEQLLNSWGRSGTLLDFDRILSRNATVDTFAMSARYAQKGARALVYAMMAETIYRLGSELADLAFKSSASVPHIDIHMPHGAPEHAPAVPQGGQEVIPPPYPETAAPHITIPHEAPHGAAMPPPYPLEHPTPDSLGGHAPSLNERIAPESTASPHSEGVKIPVRVKVETIGTPHPTAPTPDTIPDALGANKDLLDQATNPALNAAAMHGNLDHLAPIADHEIPQGSYVTQEAWKMVAEGKLTSSELMSAMEHSVAQTPHGTIPLLEANEVQPGDHLQYFAGSDGKPGLFKLVDASGHELVRNDWALPGEHTPDAVAHYADAPHHAAGTHEAAAAAISADPSHAADVIHNSANGEVVSQAAGVHTASPSSAHAGIDHHAAVASGDTREAVQQGYTVPEHDLSDAGAHEAAAAISPEAAHMPESVSVHKDVLDRFVQTLIKDERADHVRDVEYFLARQNKFYYPELRGRAVAEAYHALYNHIWWAGGDMHNVTDSIDEMAKTDPRSLKLLAVLVDMDLQDRTPVGVHYGLTHDTLLAYRSYIQENLGEHAATSASVIAEHGPVSGRPEPDKSVIDKAGGAVKATERTTRKIQDVERRTENIYNTIDRTVKRAGRLGRKIRGTI